MCLQDLIYDLKYKLSGKFKDLIVAMMKPYEYMAMRIHDALNCMGTDEETVIEVVCSSSNRDIHAIKSIYQRSMYNLLYES